MSRRLFRDTRCTWNESSDCGAAMLLVLMALAAMTTLGVGLVATSEMEASVAANFRTGTVGLYAAEAALEQVVPDVRAAANLTLLLDGTLRATFSDDLLAPMTPGGRRLDLARATSDLQSARDAAIPGGVPAPRWRLYSHGTLSSLIADIGGFPDAYLVVWIADDVADGDGDPMVDSNERLTAIARAYGARDTQRDVEVTMARRAPGVVEFLSWREVR